MGYKVISTSLFTANTAYYEFVCDSKIDLLALPNITTAGTSSDTKWMAQPGSTCTVINDAAKYILNTAGIWKMTRAVSEDVADAINENVGIMKGYLDTASKKASDAATSAQNAAASEAALEKFSGSFRVVKVESLPDPADAESDTLYMLPAKNGNSKLYYFSDGQAVLAGGKDTDLTDYTTSEQLSKALESYAKTSSLTSFVVGIEKFSDGTYLVNNIGEKIAQIPDPDLTNYIDKNTFNETLAGYAESSSLEAVNNAVKENSSAIDNQKKKSFVMVKQDSTGKYWFANALGENLQEFPSDIGADVDLSDYFTKGETESKFEEVNSSAVFGVTQDDDGLYWVTNKNDEKIFQLPISASAGSQTTVVTLTNETLNTAGEKVLTLSVAVGKEAIIKYRFTDSDPDFTATAKYLVNGVQVASENIMQGSNQFDFGPYLSAGENKCKVLVTDENDAYSSKTWVVNGMVVTLDATLNQETIYSVGEPFRISYTPVGSNMNKTTHFLIDGVEAASVSTTSSGRQALQSLTIEEHGAHDIDVYVEATSNDVTILSDTVHFCIIVADPVSKVPIISLLDKSPQGKVYSSASINYLVYDPNTERASVILTADGDSTTNTVGRTMQTWAYKPRAVGDHAMSITCGDTVVSFVYTAEDLGYTIEPVTEGLIYDFDPSGRSNSEENRDQWYSGDISLTVDSGFDWTNGGYRADADGNTAFVIKAGHRATINYNLFGTSPKVTGSNAKFIYTVKNPRKFDADVISCMSGGIGIRVDANHAYLNTEQAEIHVPLCEGERTELEYQITSQTKCSELFIYAQGCPSRFATYTSTDRLNQQSAVPVTIGSDDCDVWLYRAKAYGVSLTDDDLMDNYIADAPDAEEMVRRFEENRITDVDGNIDPDKLAEVKPGLRVIKIRCPRFTTDKNDKVSGVTVQHILKGGRARDNWVSENVVFRGQGTSSNAYGKSARNLDIDCKATGFLFSDGTTDSVYDMTENSIGEKYFNIKLNVASSENMNNAMLQELYNKYQPFLRDVRKNNPKVRDTMEFHPCAVFVYNESAEEGFTQGKYIFYGCGDFGNSKKNTNAQGLSADLHPNEVVIEICNNTAPCNRFKSYLNEGIDISNAACWESDDNPNAPLSFRYIASTCNEATARLAWRNFVKWVSECDPLQATDTKFSSTVYINGVGYVSDSAAYRKAKFASEFDTHCESDSLTYHYAFTSFFLMPDNRAKNTFWHCPDVTAANPVWECVFDYDNDTGMGINNEGDLALDFGLEDTDTIDGGDVYNAQDSVIWCNIRDILFDRVQLMFNSLTELFDEKRLNAVFSEYRSQRPPRLVMADMRRKYIRPYEELTEDGTAITMFIPMLNGTKELQCKYFLKYQCPYMASKFNSAAARNDKITLRGFSAPDGVVQKVTIVPYADIYVAALFGSVFRSKRCKRGEAVVLSMGDDVKLNDTETYFYSASMYEQISDIETIYTNQIDFSAAVKLRKLIIGSDAEDYSNPNLKSSTVLDFSGLANLEELRIDHCPNLSAPVNISGCTALKVFSAKGTPVSAAVFAPGGALEEVYLEKPTNLTLINLQNLKTFEVYDNYASLSGLRHENTPIPDVKSVIEAASKLYTLRVSGIDWNITSTDILNRMLAMEGYDENGSEISQSSVSGKVYSSVMRILELQQYNAAWPDLAVTFGETITQYKATYKNYNGEVLYEVNVDRGSLAPDPAADGTISVPTQPETQAAKFAYSGWDVDLSTTPVLEDIVITAQYESTPQQYTVKWISQLGVVDASVTVNYGEEAVHPGEDPVRTDEESSYTYRLFNGWDKSTACVTEDMEVWAIWIKGVLPSNSDSLENMNLAQLYGLKKSGKYAEYITSEELKTRVPITMGYEPEYSNIESVLLAENLELDGATSQDTGVKLFDEDRGWTMVVDGVFDVPTNESCMVSCFADTGYHGFKVKYSDGFAVQWSTNTQKNGLKTSTGTIASQTFIDARYRELAVLRHEKGSKNLIVYMSRPGSTILKGELAKTIETHSDATIILGCDNNGANFATGTLYRCKLWYADLGESECMKMAAWPREETYLEITGTAGATKTDGTKTAIDFIHSALMCVPHQMNTSSTNAGGWPASYMRTWMQNRYLPALPKPLRQMMVEVNVSSVGYVDGKNSEILESADLVYLPSSREMTGNSSEPYIYCGNHIPWFTSDAMRLRFPGINISENATITTTAEAPANPKVGDVWKQNNGRGFIWNGRYWISALNYWLRDASVAYASYFADVGYNGYWGGNSYGSAAYSYGVLPRLHI